ncbi:LysE family translocator [Haloechinothrix salitolerans]|uniref:LysE family translocator n=1 Tax=Haloechinothrix salitolerans TaxID=926830 RepID=A0ABW2C6K9_9PSEU
MGTSWSEYGSYLVLVVLLVIAPGPDTMVMLKNSLSSGGRGGLASISGIASGNILNGSAAALGLGALVAQSQTLFTVLRWFGVAYLCYLGVQALRAAWRGEYGGDVGAARRSGGFRCFREGFLSNVTNPKVLVMYLSVLPQFIDPAQTSIAEALLLANTVGVLGAIWLLLLLFVVRRARVWLNRRHVRRSMDALTGTALVGFGAALAS